MSIAKACLKCGHVSEAAEAADACPMCGAIYARVEAALVRGETILRPTPEVLARRGRKVESAPPERTGRLVSVFISIGFSIAVFTLLASLAFFGMIFSAPGDGRGDGWSKGFNVFLRCLAIGWGFAAGVSLVASLCRRPILGIFAGLGLGLVAGIAALYLLP